MTLQHNCAVNCGRFSADIKLLLTGCADGIARLWDLESSDCLRLFTGHSNAVLDARFSLNGCSIGTASADGLAKLWNKDTAECVHTFEGHEGASERKVRSLFSRLGFRNLARKQKDCLKCLQMSHSSLVTFRYSNCCKRTDVSRVIGGADK